ncbi:hypothetical protein [Mesorhizobium sp. LNHC229A00]|uniref:hypothetical protein n=1 Tax=Mesorhizobium sp. LNHC229A00 TaxID=1287240 RepID=UPI0003CED10C|nr:hypothetical protein [Mesorhizobium sp. LNHC229A00]ESY89738.1 hypothetical protein X741_29480 [Mesorhizobium sp. LNHC229A00]
MRHACLDGVRLVSDRQPTRLRVDEHTSGTPAIWLRPDGSSMAWIIVDIGERDWSRLALPVRARTRPCCHGQQLAGRRQAGTVNAVRWCGERYDRSD